MPVLHKEYQLPVVLEYVLEYSSTMVVTVYGMLPGGNYIF